MTDTFRDSPPLRKVKSWGVSIQPISQCSLSIPPAPGKYVYGGI